VGHFRPECLQSALKEAPDGWKVGFAQQDRLGHDCNEALKAEDIENAGEVVAERHQAPFAANLVETANQEVPVAGAAFERPEGMLDNGGTAAHQFICVGTLHPGAMTFDDVFVLPAADEALSCLRCETTCS